VAEVADGYARQGAAPQAAIPSPLRGGSGNVEFLLHLRRDAAPVALPIDQVVAAAAAAGA
jgi:23S rRNA (cytidine1920-2'-O)/16S rRNA (cytidine1409-2'-O)-methyltransferase